MIISLIISAIRFDFRQFGHTLLGIVARGMFRSGGAVIAVLLLKTSDDAARWLAGQPDANGQSDLSRAGKESASWIDYITGATASTPAGVRPFYEPGSFTAILISLLLIVAIVITLVALLMRNIALLARGFVAADPGRHGGAQDHARVVPIRVADVRGAAAGQAADRRGGSARRSSRLGSNAGEPQATFADAMLGVAIILLAGLLPGVIYRFSGGLMNTTAGAAPRAGAGVSAQTAQSVQSSTDMTRMLMERDAPASGPDGGYNRCAPSPWWRHWDCRRWVGRAGRSTRDRGDGHGDGGQRAGVGRSVAGRSRGNCWRGIRRCRGTERTRAPDLTARSLRRPLAVLRRLP